MSSAVEMKAIQAHIDILEERKRQLEANISTAMTVIDKCKSWIEGTEDNGISFTDLIILCAKTAAEVVFNDRTSSADSPNSRLQQYQSKDKSCPVKILTEGTEIVEKIMSRLDAVDEDISLLKSSNKYKEIRISEITEKTEVLSINLSESQNKLKKKISKSSSGLKAMINKLEQSITCHEGLIDRLSDSLEISDSTSNTKFNEIHDETSSIEKKIMSLQNTIDHLQSNIDEMTEKYILLNNNIEKYQTGLVLLTVLTEREKSEQKDSHINTEKKFSCILRLLMNKLQTVQRRFEKNVIQVNNNKKRIELISSVLQVLPSKHDKQKPWMIAGMPDVKTSIVAFVRREYEYRGEHEELINKIINFSCDSITQGTIIDDGKNYNKQKGIFKAPCDGLYLVNFQIGSSSNKPVMLASVVRNSNARICRLVYIVIVDMKDKYAQSCNVIYLDQGEEICLCADNNKSVKYFQFSCVNLN